MFIGRESETKVLNEYLYRAGNQLMVMYGQLGVGKTALLEHFIKNRENAFYFGASVLSEREQLFQWAEELNTQGMEMPQYPTYQDLFLQITALAEKSDEKTILIFDEFQNLCKVSGSFVESLFSFMEESKQEIFVILCSSSVEWIENNMVRKFGLRAKSISGFFKVKELSFKEFIKYFKNFSFAECIEGYAIFGGIPALWEMLDQELSLEENIIKRVLDKNSRLYDYGEKTVEWQLREMNVYNTILCCLAKDKKKLNDLYLHTEFSRAKISVYLKNLMELGIVEKEFSYDTDGRTNTQKGVYAIADHYVDFTYQFLFSGHRELEKKGAEEFYKTSVKPYLKAFTAKYFSVICREYLEMQNQDNRLPFKCGKIGKWIGKAGTIDCIAQDDKGHTIIGLCNWEKPMMRYEDYEWLLFCAKQAKLNVDYVYLFSAGNFDEELKFLQNSKKNVKLLTLDNL
ncbi:MAG: ATP-binding protein [Lachnospiraceae bacterium]|nr:ATP-binding protein [Lachnospiraceae bacterium]